VASGIIRETLIAYRIQFLRFQQEAEEALEKSTTLEAEIRNLLNSQKFAVLSTQEPHRPYLNLVAFSETGDLRTILFATTRATRKYANIASKSGVALLVDNRSNNEADIREAIALTILGNACEVPQSQKEELERVYLQKQPQMKKFVSSPSTALIKIDVEAYIFVSRFENVTMLNFKS
jgi:heme iron utilization protein